MGREQPMRFDSSCVRRLHSRIHVPWLSGRESREQTLAVIAGTVQERNWQDRLYSTSLLGRRIR